MKYSFDKEIKGKLKGFKKYLQKSGYSENTIRQTSNYTGCFLEWLEKEHLSPENTGYNDMLSFIDCCRAEENSTRLINNKLRSIRKYYGYLKKQGGNITNPAQNLYVKGTRYKIPANLVSVKELEEVYNSYQTNTLRQKRNKAVLGLLVYQGTTTEELKELETGHLKLKQGKIYIPGSRRRNSRTLELKPFQVMELHEYISEIRPKIVAGIYGNKPTGCAARSTRTGRKPDKINKTRLENQLFISMNGSEHIKNSLLHLFKEIQKTRPEILHAKQIRASAIVGWLKTNNLRQVQYMAGHKYVSSTERYQLDNLEKLQEKLEKYHPLNNT